MKFDALKKAYLFWGDKQLHFTDIYQFLGEGEWVNSLEREAFELGLIYEVRAWVAGPIQGTYNSWECRFYRISSKVLELE